MASMLFFPGMHAACAYTSLIDQAVIYLPSLRMNHFPDSNLERIASVADAVLEKTTACNLRPPSVYCAACTWPEQRTASRSPKRRLSPKKSEQPQSLSTAPLSTSEISVSVATPSSPRESVGATKDAGEIAFRAISPPKRRNRLPPVDSLPEDEITRLPPPRRADVHQVACEFEDTLLKHFGSLPIAFQFLDSATGKSTGQISATKFRYSWKTLAIDGDMRSVFPYMDINGDGVIDEDEFKSWRSIRQRQKDQLITVSLPNADSSN